LPNIQRRFLKAIFHDRIIGHRIIFKNGFVINDSALPDSDLIIRQSAVLSRGIRRFGGRFPASRMKTWLFL